MFLHNISQELEARLGTDDDDEAITINDSEFTPAGQLHLIFNSDSLFTIYLIHTGKPQLEFSEDTPSLETH